MGKNTNQRGNRNRRAADINLDRLRDGQLLDLRFCDLPIALEDTVIERRVARLYGELEARGIYFKPHVWLSNEWFSPDGVPGIAVPFYLVHPRLAKLEKKQILEVEGGSDRECMRILRHEAGHAIDTAYRLHFKKRWRELFGSFSDPYPDWYKPRPDSRDHVLHLRRWYAQSHPAEDFAETFAVWLDPNSRWRSRYQSWPALRKLEYVNDLMKEIAGQPPVVRSRAKIEPISRLTRTLRRHYRDKRLHYADEWPDFYDRDLRRIFSSDPQFADRPTAASYLRRIQPELRHLVADWTGTYQYTIDQVLQDMIDRCKELKLRLAMDEADAKQHAMIMLTVQTMNYVLTGHYRVAL